MFILSEIYVDLYVRNFQFIVKFTIFFAYKLPCIEYKPYRRKLDCKMYVAISLL